MNSLQWYDWIRVLTIILCLITMYRLQPRITKKWFVPEDYPREFFPILLGSVGFIAVNSLERIIDDNDIHVGFFLGFLISVYVFTMTLHTKTKAPDNS